RRRESVPQQYRAHLRAARALAGPGRRVQRDGTARGHAGEPGAGGRGLHRALPARGRGRRPPRPGRLPGEHQRRSRAGSPARGGVLLDFTRGPGPPRSASRYGILPAAKNAAVAARSSVSSTTPIQRPNPAARHAALGASAHAGEIRRTKPPDGTGASDAYAPKSSSLNAGPKRIGVRLSRNGYCSSTFSIPFSKLPTRPITPIT